MVKVTQISTVNISQALKRNAKINIVMKYECVDYRLAYLDLTLVHFKGQGQDLL